MRMIHVLVLLQYDDEKLGDNHKLEAMYMRLFLGVFLNRRSAYSNISASTPFVLRKVRNSSLL